MHIQNRCGLVSAKKNEQMQGVSFSGGSWGERNAYKKYVLAKVVTSSKIGGNGKLVYTRAFALPVSPVGGHDLNSAGCRGQPAGPHGIGSVIWKKMVPKARPIM